MGFLKAAGWLSSVSAAAIHLTLAAMTLFRNGGVTCIE